MFENDIINQAHLAHLLDPWRLGVWMGKVTDSKDLCPSGVSWDTDFSGFFWCIYVSLCWAITLACLFSSFSMDRLMFESSIFVWGAFEEHLVHLCWFLDAAQQHLFTEVNSTRPAGSFQGTVVLCWTCTCASDAQHKNNKSACSKSKATSGTNVAL